MLKTMGRVATAGALALALTTSFALAGCSQSDDAATEPAATQGSAAQESTEVDTEKEAEPSWEGLRYIATDEETGNRVVVDENGVSLFPDDQDYNAIGDIGDDLVLVNWTTESGGEYDEEWRTTSDVVTTNHYGYVDLSTQELAFEIDPTAFPENQSGAYDEVSQAFLDGHAVLTINGSTCVIDDTGSVLLNLGDYGFNSALSSFVRLESDSVYFCDWQKQLVQHIDFEGNILNTYDNATTFVPLENGYYLLGDEQYVYNENGDAALDATTLASDDNLSVAIFSGYANTRYIAVQIFNNEANKSMYGLYDVVDNTWAIEPQLDYKFESSIDGDAKIVGVTATSENETYDSGEVLLVDFDLNPIAGEGGSLLSGTVSDISVLDSERGYWLVTLESGDRYAVDVSDLEREPLLLSETVQES